MFEGAERVHELLGQVAEAMELEGSGPVGIVVCGGAGLQVLGFVSRVTQDIDVVALVVDGTDAYPKPLPGALREAVLRVAQDRGLPEDWLNAGPADNQALGLPEGLLERATVREYGELLRVWFLSRFDQIHFKLYAVVDQGGPGKHLDDLTALSPTADEMRSASLWSMSHDPSPGFKQVLLAALRALGFGVVADGLE